MGKTCYKSEVFRKIRLGTNNSPGDVIRKSLLDKIPNPFKQFAIKTY